MTKSVLKVAFAASFAFALGTGTAAADHHANPCGENPCATNPCATNPCATPNPCGTENPCGTPAEGEWEGEGGAAAHDDGRSLVVPQGKLAAALTVTANMSKDAIFEPFSVSPDIWFGAAENLAIGLVHSSYGINGFFGSPVQSLCLASDTKGCPDVYTSGFLEGRYQFMASDSAVLAGQVGVGTQLIDPFVLAAKVGLMARILTGGPVMIDVNPNVQIRITERDGGGAGNEQWFLPINLIVMAAPNVAVMLQTGVSSTFKDLGENYRVPVSLGACFMVTPMIGIVAAFTANAVLDDNDASDAFDSRAATLGLVWHN